MALREQNAHLQRKVASGEGDEDLLEGEAQQKIHGKVSLQHGNTPALKIRTLSCIKRSGDEFGSDEEATSPGCSGKIKTEFRGVFTKEIACTCCLRERELLILPPGPSARPRGVASADSHTSPRVVIQVEEAGWELLIEAVAPTWMLQASLLMLSSLACHLRGRTDFGLYLCPRN